MNYVRRTKIPLSQNCHHAIPDQLGSLTLHPTCTACARRNVIKLLDLTGERISIAGIDRVIKSLPTRPEEYEEEGWQRESYCAQLIASIRERRESLTADQWSDLDFATQYIFNKWPAFDERPRSSLEMTWSGMADKFLFNPFHRLFCSGECSFTPEDTTHRGNIVICVFPLLEYGHETGQTITKSFCGNLAIKIAHQQNEPTRPPSCRT